MADPSRADLTENDVHERLTQVFVDHLARNTSYFGGGGPGYYGVRLENIARDGSELDLIVTFQAGERYCCSEPGCHFDFRSTETWSGVRRDMDVQGLRALPLPRIHILRVVVEEGALFDPGGLRFPPLKSRGHVHEHGPFLPVIEPGEK
jgi:hypothetical protein